MFIDVARGHRRMGEPGRTMAAPVDDPGQFQPDW